MKDVRIILVDDEAGFRKATGQALSRRGFTVLEAESGELALSLAASSDVEVMLLDLRMPGMSGIDTLKEIRRQHPDLPVIILTGHGALDDALAGFHLGIVDFIQKPVDIDHLAARIRKLFEGQSRQTLRETRIEELIVPVSAYRRVYADQTVRDVIRELKATLFPSISGGVTEQGHRAVLVFDRKENFVGTCRLNDILTLALPPALIGSPYASYLSGMFTAQCKLLGGGPIGDIVENRPSIDVDAPLMEALHLMVTEKLINLPVLRNGKLIGLLRDKDLLLDIAGAVLGDE